ncbi:phosphatidylinositol alpha-1,6-mannosyltransferase [Flavobacteriaceae bacterium MAR_2010_188]|nr:phosphatidylinositol alpha-1,6-mannosyltransferase [Flavobacteriaceae bacterium MAR_2010_188]
MIVASEFPPQPGGIGNHAYNLAKNLSLQGYSISVLTDNRYEEGLEELEFDKSLDFEVIRIRKRRNRFVMYLQRLKKLKILKKNKDVIIASGKFSLWAVALISRSSKTKNLAVIHGTEVNLSNKVARFMVNISLPNFERLIAVSKYTQGLIHPKVRDRSIVIPNGYNSQHWKLDNSFKRKVEPLRPSLVTVGNVNYRKGQQNVIEKMPDLLKIFPNAIYHIIGLPTQREEFEKLAKSVGVAEKVVFHGVVSQSKIIQLVSEADIFVMLSSPSEIGDVEGFGIAVIEANSLGLPAIGSKDCGIEDAIDDNKSGILIDFDDTDAFCRAISLITKNYEKFSANSISWAVKHKWEFIVQKYIREIER